MNSKLKNGTEETPEQRIIRKTKRYMDIGKTGGYAPVIGFLLTVIEEYKEMAHAVRQQDYIAGRQSPGSEIDGLEEF